MRAVCLKHVPFEGPGAFATALKNLGISLPYRLVPKNGLPPDPDDSLIVMGGIGLEFSLDTEKTTQNQCSRSILRWEIAVAGGTPRQRCFLAPFVRRDGLADSHFSRDA